MNIKKNSLKNEGLSSKNRRNENGKPGTLWEISVSFLVSFFEKATEIVMAGFGFILRSFGKSRSGHNFA